MTKDPFWDELGVAWIADTQQIGAAAPVLKSHLRRQTRLMTWALVLSTTVALAGILLGAATIWLGLASGAWNFVTRGIAIVLVALLAACGAATIFPVRAADNARAVSEMIALSLARARRTLRLVDLALAGTAIAAVFGVAGTFIRTHLSGPPKLSPVVDLAVLGLVAAILVLLRQRTQAKLAKLEFLQRAMAPEA